MLLITGNLLTYFMCYTLVNFWLEFHLKIATWKQERLKLFISASCFLCPFCPARLCR